MSLMLSSWKEGQFAGSTTLAQNPKICPCTSHRCGLAKLLYNGRKELAAALLCLCSRRVCGCLFLAHVPADSMLGETSGIHPASIYCAANNRESKLLLAGRHSPWAGLMPKQKGNAEQRGTCRNDRKR